MNAGDYIRSLLSKPVVPSYCAWPAWLGPAFKMEDYSNFTREVEIIHGRRGDPWMPGPKCVFRASPLTIVESGVCPKCKKVEFTPFNGEWRREANAKDAYRAIVTAYSQRAMRYLVECWWKVRRDNKGRRHIDHIFPVARGFQHGIEEHIIGSPVNCRLLSAKANLSKGSKPGQSLEQLLSRYDAFAAKDPYWKHLPEYLDKTGTLSDANIR